MTVSGPSGRRTAEVPVVHWVDGRWLAVVDRPTGSRGLTGWARHLRDAGIDIIVSALETTEAAGLGLGGEAAAVRDAGMEFVSVYAWVASSAHAIGTRHLG